MRDRSLDVRDVRLGYPGLVRASALKYTPWSKLFGCSGCCKASASQRCKPRYVSVQASYTRAARLAWPSILSEERARVVSAKSASDTPAPAGSTPKDPLERYAHSTRVLQKCS
jgi:hypothetical protein